MPTVPMMPWARSPAQSANATANYVVNWADWLTGATRSSSEAAMFGVQSCKIQQVGNSCILHL